MLYLVCGSVGALAYVVKQAVQAAGGPLVLTPFRLTIRLQPPTLLQAAVLA